MALLETIRDRSIKTILARFMPAKVCDNRPRLLLCCSVFMVLTSLMLGGGTRGGFLSDAILELLAIPVLLIALASLLGLLYAQPHLRSRMHLLLASSFIIFALPLIQLVPLPPWIWTRLPAHSEIMATYDLLGRGLPWLPISTSADATWLSLLSLLPPMAVFFGVIQLAFSERRVLSLAIIAFGVISIVLGLAQLSQGPSGWLRFFTITNANDAVGFFANRNHFAALLYTVLLFAAAWAIDRVFKIEPWRTLRGIVLAPGASLVAIATVFMCLFIGEAFVVSRAGLTLTIIALIGVFALILGDRRKLPNVKTKFSKLVLATVSFAIILIMQFAIYRFMNRYSVDTLHDARLVFARNTLQAAVAFFPFGSGLGTFVQVYGMFEEPGDALINTFVNHAHNDFVELFLETGLLGMSLVGAFLVWFGFSAVKVWSKPFAAACQLDSALARTATLIIGLLLAHSVVDYPLRTEAMMGIFVFSCALLIEPLMPAQTDVKQPWREADRPAQPETRGAERPIPEPSSPQSAPEHAQPWGDDIEWPDAWRS
jgi:O-antigen ligase